MRRALCVCLTLTAVVLAACSDDDGGAGSGDPTSISSLLEYVPDTVGVREGELYYTNLDRIRGGATATDADADVSLLLRETSLSLQLPRRFADCFVSRSEGAPGFDTRTITTALEFGYPPDEMQLLVGDFSAEAVERALRSGPGGDGLQVSTEGGTTRFAVGEEGTNEIADRTCFRRVGESLRLAIGAPGLIAADSDALLDAVLAAPSGASLADDVGYTRVASALDAAAVEQAVLTGPFGEASWSLAGLGEVVTADDDSGTRDPAVVTYVFLFADEAAAATGADSFRMLVESGVTSANGQPWSDLLTITDLTIDGALVTATMQATSAGLYIRPVAMLEPLVQI